MDREGYGYGEHQSFIDRLLEDLRTLGPSGIERIAEGFSRLEGTGEHERFHQLERKALQSVEVERGDDWEELKAQIHHLTDGGGSLQSWKAEHGDTGHRAEAAVLGGALGLLALPSLERDDYLHLVSPLAEALPWVRSITPEGRIVEAPDPE
jgi:hypothetical protein